MNLVDLKRDHVKSMYEIVKLCQLEFNLGAGLAWTERELLDSLLKGIGIGVFESNQLNGFILFNEIPEDFGPIMDIQCLATRPSEQSKGVMSFLIQNLKTRSQEIWLEVHESNIRAQLFYKAKGFQEVGLRKSYYKDKASALLFSWVSEKHERD